MCFDVVRGSRDASATTFLVHFFLDFHRKEPYKGDTTALSLSGAKFDVKGESIDEERNEEKGACEKEGCSEEKEVVSRLDSSSSNPRPREIGADFLWRGP